MKKKTRSLKKFKKPVSLYAPLVSNWSSNKSNALWPSKCLQNGSNDLCLCKKI